MFIDAIGIGFPALNGVSYMGLLYSLLGLRRHRAAHRPDGPPIAHQPVLAPLTWSSMTDADAEFEWSYTDPETGETATSDDQYEDHCKLSARLLRREHHAQQLHPATHPHRYGPGSAPGSYTAPYVFFQAGGKADAPHRSGRIRVRPAAVRIPELGIIYTTVDDETIGD